MQMDPNQQPGQIPTPTAPVQPPVPQTPSAYAPPVQTSYDPNYLDSIAPTAPRAKFLSGSFGKVFWVLIVLFFIAVSLIIAFSGKDDTADLQQAAVRLENFAKTAKTTDKNLKSKNLRATNSKFRIWMSGSQSQAEDLLAKGGVKKTEYNKTMKKTEASLAASLDAKFEDARLSARLDRVYASTMALETEKLINLFNKMSKQSKSKLIRDYAKTTSGNLTQIQKDFDGYVDDGN